MCYLWNTIWNNKRYVASSCSIHLENCNSGCKCLYLHHCSSHRMDHIGVNHRKCLNHNDRPWLYVTPTQNNWPGMGCSQQQTILPLMHLTALWKNPSCFAMNEQGQYVQEISFIQITQISDTCKTRSKYRKTMQTRLLLSVGLQLSTL